MLACVFLLCVKFLCRSLPGSKSLFWSFLNLYSVRYQVEKLSETDRSMFIERLVEAVFLIPPDGMINQSKGPTTLPELPKAPKASSGPKVSELKAKAEAEQHALRRLRMCLRDVCNRSVFCEYNYTCSFLHGTESRMHLRRGMKWLFYVLSVKGNYFVQIPLRLDNML